MKVYGGSTHCRFCSQPGQRWARGDADRPGVHICHRCYIKLVGQGHKRTKPPCGRLGDRRQ